jgi:hypothetical protein
MTAIASAREYVEQLKARVLRCASITPADRPTVPAKFDTSRNTWVVTRGFDAPEELFADDPAVGSPFELAYGGQLSLRVRVRERRRRHSSLVEVVAYQLSLVDIPSDRNSIRSLRFDKPDGQPRGAGWDDELQDNPRHPHAHVHFNFLDDNDCRLPTASICPLLLFTAFDYWYCTTFRA